MSDGMDRVILEQLSEIRNAISELQSDLVSRVSVLENETISLKIITGSDGRLSKVEDLAQGFQKLVWYFSGCAATCGVFAGWFVRWIVKG